MAVNQTMGRASISYGSPVFIKASGSVVGQMESEGPLGSYFDKVGTDKDDLFGADSWEKAESALQKEAVGITLQKAGIKAEDIRYLFAGDLLGQNIASSFGVMDYEIPLFGLYGACSTCGESLCLGSHVSDIQSLCQRTEGISLSFGIWRTKTPVRNVDCYGKCCFYSTASGASKRGRDSICIFEKNCNHWDYSW